MQNYAEYAEYGPGADLREGGGRRAGGARPTYFFRSLVFCNHFKELKIVLLEV